MVAKPSSYAHHMTLWRPSLGTASATGEQPVTAVEVGKLWCSLRPISGREALIAAQTQSQTTHIVRTWYRTDITPDETMHLTLDSRRFDIESVQNVGEIREEFEFRVVEHL